MLSHSGQWHSKLISIPSLSHLQNGRESITYTNPKGIFPTMTPSTSAIRIQRRSTTVWILFRRYLSESTIGKHNQPYIMVPSNYPMSINRKAGTSIDSIPYRYNNYLADFFKSNCSSLRVNICKINAEGQYNMSGVYLIQLAVVILKSRFHSIYVTWDGILDSLFVLEWINAWKQLN